MTPPMQIRTLTSVPFEENCYVVWLPGRDDAVVIDPGLEPEIILDFLRDKGLTSSAILNTHGHADHIAGNEAMKQKFPDAPLVIGANDAPLLASAELNLSAAFGFGIISPQADRLVKEGDVVETA